jgi:hypothetical protein
VSSTHSAACRYLACAATGRPNWLAQAQQEPPSLASAPQAASPEAQQCGDRPLLVPISSQRSDPPAVPACRRQAQARNRQDVVGTYEDQQKMAEQSA